MCPGLSTHCYSRFRGDESTHFNDKQKPNIETVLHILEKAPPPQLITTSLTLDPSISRNERPS
jgi:hypothetical protein